MLPTPDTSHVLPTRVYEPSEDSYLLLDTLSSPSETAFLTSRFRLPSAPIGIGASVGAGAPFVVEIGPGSGVVVAFVHAHAEAILGTRSVLVAAVDANPFACAATIETVRLGEKKKNEKYEEGEEGEGKNDKRQQGRTHGSFLGAVVGDLVSPLRPGTVDVLIFNPPYVPTETVPAPPGDSSICRPPAPALASQSSAGAGPDSVLTQPPLLASSARPKPKSNLSFDDESYLLALAYAGGRDGMEITDRLIAQLPGTLSARGCAYILLCARNRPEEVKRQILALGDDWRIETVGESGGKAGWERLQVLRLWRDIQGGGGGAGK